MNTATQNGKVDLGSTVTLEGAYRSYPQSSDGLSGPLWCNCGGGFVCPECRR